MDNSLQVQEPQPIGPKFLSIKTVGKLTGLSRSTLCRQIKNGSIRSTKVGSRVLVDASYINDLIAKSNKEAKA